MSLHSFRTPWLRLVHLIARAAWLLQPLSFKVEAGQVTSNGHTLTVSPGQDRVDAGGSTVINAQLLDENNAPVQGAVLWFDLGGSATYSASTDGNGQCAMGFTAGTWPVESSKLRVVCFSSRTSDGTEQPTGRLPAVWSRAERNPSTG